MRETPLCAISMLVSISVRIFSTSSMERLYHYRLSGASFEENGRIPCFSGALSGVCLHVRACCLRCLFEATAHVEFLSDHEKIAGRPIQGKRRCQGVRDAREEKREDIAGLQIETARHV